MPVPIPAWGQDRTTPFLHFERLPRHADNYLVRAWGPRLNAHLAFDEFTAQPWAPYEGTCILTVRDDDPLTGEVKGILRVPFATFLRLRGQVASEIGISEIWGERWREPEKRIIRLPLAGPHPKEKAAGG